MKTIYLLVFGLFVLSSCHYRIESYSFSNFGQFHNPYMRGDTFMVYQQPTPFDYIEQIYLNTDSTFTHIISGDILNLEPVHGKYQIKGRKLILFPFYNERKLETLIYLDEHETKDSLYIDLHTTWGYDIPMIRFISTRTSDTLFSASYIKPASNTAISLPNNLDTIEVSSCYLDNPKLILTPSILKGKNRVTVYFGITGASRFKIESGEMWRFNSKKTKLRHQKYSLFRKRHPYYYIGKEIIKDN